MAMDVVDTLRHEEAALTRELGQDDRDETLMARLREIYEGQGLEVTDEILAEGIAALRESRFVYEPPRPSLAVSLAKLWVTRSTWGGWAGGGVALLLVWLFWSIWSGGADGRLADRLRDAGQETLALGATDTARERVEAVTAEGVRFATAGETGGAEEALARLTALREELALAYELRIVVRDGEQTGVYRIPDANTNARNFYIIVEAVDGGGALLERPVTNEETGRTERVSKWGVRVPESTFVTIGRDKRDDGIVQQRTLGTKSAGRLDLDWALPVSGGAITEW